MSGYNGSGTFVISGTGLPYVTGTTISSTVANQLDTDLATGLSNAICKDGQSTPTANIPLGGFKLTNVGNATTAGDTLIYGGSLGTPSGGTLTNCTGLTPSGGGKPANRFTSFTNTTSVSLVSATLQMGGFGSTWKLTPATTGNVRFRVSGNASITAGASVVMNMRYGTGTAPVTGAAVTGSGGTTTDLALNAGASANLAYWEVAYEATGLTLSTAYWFDICARSALTNSIIPISIIIEEF